MRRVESIPVYADEAARIDVRLRIGGSSETVVVSAEDVPLLKVDRADVQPRLATGKSKVSHYSTEISPAWNYSRQAPRSCLGNTQRSKTLRAAFRLW